MTFDRADIRPAIDVFTSDNVYLGTVLAITAGPQSAPQHHVIQDAREGSSVSGELLGPMPTQTLGNRGPWTQAASTRYATTPDGARPLGQGTITVGKWYGLLGKRTFSLDAIQTVSLERVTLRLRSDEC